MSADFVTTPSTYKKVPQILFNYFRLKCGSAGLFDEEFRWEESVDERGYTVYTVDCWSARTDKVMQGVWEELHNSPLIF